MNHLEHEHERWRDDLASFLLGALEPGEAADFERHLAGCEECRTEISWLRPAIQVLPEGVERLEPPPALRERVMVEARSDIDSSAGVERSPSRPLRRFLGIRRRSDSGAERLGMRPLAGLAAAALLIAVFAGYAIQTGSGGGGTATIVSGHPPGVTAKMVREGDGGTLELADVRQLPNGKILQAWVQRGHRIYSAHSLFAPARNGTATATIANMAGVNAVMVTAEPEGGSAQPTSAPIVTLAVPQ